MINVSGSNLGIGISLIMRDGFSGPAKIAGANMDEIAAKAHRLATQQMTMARNANAMGAAIGAAAIYDISKWVDEASRFNYTMKYVSSISGGVGKDFDKLNNKAVTLGEKTMFTAAQIADGMRWMAQAGMDAKSIYASMGAVTDLAGSTMTDIEGRGGAADWVTNIARGFNIALNEKNVTKIADVLAVATNKSNLNLHELGEAMKYTYSTAYDLKMSLEETAAGVMVLSNAGITGSMAGTALENMLRYVTRAAGKNATKRQREALGILGMTREDLVDAKGNLLSYGVILKKVSETAGKMGTADAQNALIDLFGVRGKRGASTISAHLMTYYQFLNDLNNAGGQASEWMGNMMNTAHGSILQLTSAWLSFKIAFFEALEPIIVPFVNALTALLKMLNAIVRTGLGKILVVAATFMLIGKTAAMAFRAVLYTVRLLAGDVGTVLVSSTAAGTAGLNNMTNAANRTASAMGRVFGMGAGLSGGLTGGLNYLGFGNKNRGGVKWAKNGRPYIIGPGGGAQFISNKAAENRNVWGSKVGGYMTNNKRGGFADLKGKGLGWGFLGALGLGMASSAVGTEGAFGTGLGIAADSASWGLTGATVGSIIPFLGTGVGAIVGAVGGLLWGLYDKIWAVKAEIESTDTASVDEVSAQGKWKRLVGSGILDPDRMGEKLGSYQKYTYDGHGRGFGPFWDQNRQFSSTIIVNLNGDKVYEEEIDDPNSQADVNVGIK